MIALQKGCRKKATPQHKNNRRSHVGLKLTLVGGLLLLAGCASITNPFAPSKTASTTGSAKDLGLNDFNGSAVPTRTYVVETAREHQMPDQFVAEARTSLAEIERAIAAARAAELSEEATLREGLAKVTAERESATARENATLAEAEKIQKQYQAKQQEMWAMIASRERTLNSSAAEADAMIEALRKERDMVYNEMRSQASNEYAQAKAQIERLQVVRGATAGEGQAALEDMRENLHATQTRAGATVSKLRTEAQSIRQQSSARAEELKVQVSTMRAQSKAEAEKLKSAADSLQKDSLAKYNEMIARASALTEQGSEENYDLKVNAAETALRKAKAEHERLLNAAETTLERAEAQIARTQSDAEKIAFIGQTSFRQGMNESETWRDNELAEVAKMRAAAERDERHARAEFVKAEAAARANAIRETAEHKKDLAEAEMKKIIAEAEHEAAKVRAQILDELARRQQSDSVEFAGKTEGPKEPTEPSNLHDVPPVPQVTPVTPRVEPEHIAAFRSALAKVMKQHSTIEAKEMAIEATFNETRTRHEAILAQFEALSQEKLAIADAMAMQADAQYAELNAQAEALMAVAEAEYHESIANADAFRKEMLAEASDLRATAQATRELGATQAELLRVEATVVANNGESEARALEAKLDATRRRGDAEFSRLMVEADSIEKSNKALAAQIGAEIVAAERILEAELAKQDRTIESAIAVAEANFNEASVNADVFARKSDVEIDRMIARNNLEHAVTAAELEHLRNLSFSAVLKADASVGRIMASARSEREQAEALADALAASLRSGSDIAKAEILAQSRSAEARENAVRATFDARLVQVQSERLRHTADIYQDDLFKQANLETTLAQAEAARNEMKERFAQLKIEQSQLQRSARQNWDSRLASMQKREPAPLPKPQFDLPNDLEDMKQELLTNVPINLD